MLICLAVDYRTADVATRERFHVAEQRLGEMYGALLGGALEGCADVRHSLEPDAEISHCCARLVPREATEAL